MRSSSQVCISGASGGGSLWVSPLGILDTTFGTGGYRLTNIGVTNYSNVVALQVNNQPMLGGLGSSQFALARYQLTGSLDTTFGTAGITTTNPTGMSDYIHSIAFQSDGKFVVVGDDDLHIVRLARYSTTGILDTTFGAAGITTTTITGNPFSRFKIAIQSTGNIIIAGDMGSNDFIVGRYNSSGVLDTTFGTAGITQIDFYGSSDSGYGVKLSNNNSIFVGGAITNGGNQNFGLAKLSADGALDTTFGTGGKVDISIPTLTGEQSYDLVVQSDGKIVLVGYGDNAVRYGALARYTANGILDTTFGASGTTVTDFSHGGIYSAALQPDDKIVVVGNANTNDPTVVRYTSNGILDSTFGVGGIVTFTALAGQDFRSIALATTGEIYAAGIGWNGANQDFFIAKFK